MMCNVVLRSGLEKAAQDMPGVCVPTSGSTCGSGSWKKPQNLKTIGLHQTYLPQIIV